MTRAVQAIPEAQRRLLADIILWGEIGPDAENVTGCTGAAFWSVANSLRSKGLVDDEYQPTAAGRETASFLNARGDER